MSEIALVITAVGSVVGVLVASLRKRQDVDVEELKKRTADLLERVKKLQDTVDALRADLVVMEADNFRLRRTLASHGIADPTQSRPTFPDGGDVLS